MRLHPIIWMLGRVASRDDVIPLAFPITTKSGERVSSIPVKKGTNIDIAVHAYQRYVRPTTPPPLYRVLPLSRSNRRLPQVWGEDADEWNPDRFLDTEAIKQTSIGVYGNL